MADPSAATDGGDDEYGTTIGVYLPPADEALKDSFDRQMAELWPAGQSYHRSAAMRAVMRALVEAASALGDAGVLPPAEDVETAEDAERAVARALAGALALGAEAQGAMAEKGWATADGRLRARRAAIRQAIYDRDRWERENLDGGDDADGGG